MVEQRHAASERPLRRTVATRTVGAFACSSFRITQDFPCRVPRFSVQYNSADLLLVQWGAPRLAVFETRVLAPSIMFMDHRLPVASVLCSFVPRFLHRYYGSGDLHFITCSCFQRQPFLAAVRHRDLFLKVLEAVRHRYRVVVLG